MRRLGHPPSRVTASSHARPLRVRGICRPDRRYGRPTAQSGPVESRPVLDGAQSSPSDHSLARSNGRPRSRRLARFSSTDNFSDAPPRWVSHHTPGQSDNTHSCCAHSRPSRLKVLLKSGKHCLLDEATPLADARTTETFLRRVAAPQPEVDNELPSNVLATPCSLYDSRP